MDVSGATVVVCDSSGMILEKWDVEDKDKIPVGPNTEGKYYQTNKKVSVYKPLENEIYEFRDEECILKIKKLKFHSLCSRDGRLIGILELQFKDGIKRKFCIFRNKESLLSFDEEISLNGVSNSYSIEESVSKLDWRGTALSCFYTKRIEEKYDSIFKIISQQLESTLSSHNHLGKNILLISPGCGTANELAYLDKTLGDRFNFNYTGFDINKSNIAKAQVKLKGFFECDSFDNLPTRLKKINNKFSQIAIDFSIIIFSGVLAESVVEGSRTALQYLQYTLRDTKVQYVVIASASNSFIDKRIAKASGLLLLNSTTIPGSIDPDDGKIIISDPVLLCGKPSPQQRIDYILRQSTKRQDSCTDLSCSANPLVDLKLLEEYAPDQLKKSDKLDLSWCYVSGSEEEKQIRNFIIDYKFKVIFIAPSCPWGKELSLQFPNTSFYERLDGGKDGLLPFSSIPCNQRLGYFEFNKIPSRLLTQDANPVTLYQKALELYGLKDFKGAINFLDQSVYVFNQKREKNVTMFSRVYSTMASCYRELGRVDKAIECCTVALDWCAKGQGKSVEDEIQSVTAKLDKLKITG